MSGQPVLSKSGEEVTGRRLLFPKNDFQKTLSDSALVNGVDQVKLGKYSFLFRQPKRSKEEGNKQPRHTLALFFHGSKTKDTPFESEF